MFGVGAVESLGIDASLETDCEGLYAGIVYIGLAVGAIECDSSFQGGANTSHPTRNMTAVSSAITPQNKLSNVKLVDYPSRTSDAPLRPVDGCYHSFRHARGKGGHEAAIQQRSRYPCVIRRSCGYPKGGTVYAWEFGR